MAEQGNIAIIPARSGSKGLKDKNIKLLAGKPLLAYTVEAAIQSGIFNEIYVSTDSEEYARIAKEFGAQVPFLRSEETATDKASSWAVVREALQHYREAGREFAVFTLLQPTTPLRRAEDIISAFHLFQTKKASAVVSVCEVDHSPLWSNTLPESLSMDKFIRKEINQLPRQELQTYYRINGGIYMVNTEHFLCSEEIYTDGTYAYIMDRKDSIDIDDEFDFKMAEVILSMKESTILI